MADNIITTNITAHADFTSLRAQLAAVTAQLIKLQETTAGTNAKLANQIAVMNKSFATTLTSTGQFSQHFVSLSSDVDKFGKNLDRGRLKLNDYYNAWNGHTKKTSNLIRDLAKQQVMLQQAIVQPVGKNAQGLMQYNVMVAKGLDEVKNKMALARQEAAIMNKVMLDGATGLINWGKNTQWAGRQLTVGLTVPLVAFGAAAQKAFREADAELVRLTKVYGGLAATSSADLAQVRKDVSATAREIASSYGVAYKDTISLAADLAATGKQGNDLLQATKQTTRLAVLGEVDRADAMKATLAIQNAFKQNTDELTQSIDFLNAVENQTSTSLADLTEAIPKAGPVIKALGGDVKDLALYLTAMKEGGVNAAEGANAIKSAMASLINPTKVATGLFAGFGIDLKGIVNNNAGDLTATIMALQAALDKLNPLDKSRAIEQLFGKFQFARMSALFENLGKQGSQTLQVMDLMKASASDLASISERELKLMTESASGQFKRALASVQADLASAGEQFLKISTKVLKVVDAIIKFFQHLPGPVKTFLNVLGGLTAIAGPLIMMAGVMGNFIGYVVKGIFHLRQLAKGGQGFKLLTPEIIAADAAAKGLATSFYSDSEAAIVLSNAVNTLAESFINLEAKANAAKVSVQPAVSTVAGGVIMGGTPGSGRVVDKDHPMVGSPYSRDMSHLIPSGNPQAGTIFGTVPGAKPVNIRVGRNPQAYMNEDLPKIPGLTSIGGVSTGIVASEAARWHAMTAAISMQSEAELAILKKEVMATGTITASLSDSYQALLPEFSQITELAAQEVKAIVAEVQANKITVEAARAKIISLNATVEAMLAETAAMTATSMGRTANLTTVPLTSQPVVDPITGKANMKEMFHKGSTREIVDRIARALAGIRTSGAGYNIETTKPKLNKGGIVPGTGNTDTYHTTAEPGSFVINKAATEKNLPLITNILGSKSYYAQEGGQVPVVLTPGEAVIPASFAQKNMPLMYQLNGGAGNTSGSGMHVRGGLLEGKKLALQRTHITEDLSGMALLLPRELNLGVNSNGSGLYGSQIANLIRRTLDSGIDPSSLMNEAAVTLGGDVGQAQRRNSVALQQLIAKLESPAYGNKMIGGKGNPFGFELLAKEIFAPALRGIKIDSSKAGGRRNLYSAISQIFTSRAKEVLTKDDAIRRGLISGPISGSSQKGQIVKRRDGRLSWVSENRTIGSRLPAWARGTNLATLLTTSSGVSHALKIIRRNSGGEIPGEFAQRLFNGSPNNQFGIGGLLGNVLKGKAMQRIGAGFGPTGAAKPSTFESAPWGVNSLSIKMAETLFASTGLRKYTQKLFYDKFAAALAKEKPYGYVHMADGTLKRGLEPDALDAVIRSAASDMIGDRAVLKQLSPIDREILKTKYLNWESRKDTPLTETLKKLIFNLEGRATGGPVNAGQPYIVGEKGPELFVPRNAGGIVPNSYGIGGQVVAGLGLSAIANMIASKITNPLLSTIVQQAGYMLPMMLSPSLGGATKGIVGRGLTKVGLGKTTTPLAFSNKNPGEMTKFGNALAKAESSGTKFGSMISKVGLGLTRFNLISAVVVGGLLFAKNRFDANTESMRLNALGYGMTEEAAKKAGLKFRDFNKSLKESVETAKAVREQNQLLYQSMTGSGTPLKITIAEFKKLKKTVKTDFADQIKLIDKTSADDQLALAERLKTMFIGMGMSSEEATKKIYAMYTVSKNFSSSASLYTVSSEGFNKIKTSVDAAAAAIRLYNKTVHEGRDGTEQANAFTTANSAILTAIDEQQTEALKNRKKDKTKPTFISTADKNVIMLDAEVAAIEKISKAQRYQKTVSQATLNEMEKTNPLLREIADLHDTNISLMQKQRLIAKGFTLDMRGLTAAQTDQVYRFNIAITKSIESVAKNGFLQKQYKHLDGLKQLQEKYTKAMKGQSVAQQISDRDKLSALQKQIDANNKLADARIKALDAAKKEGDIGREIAKAQARYEAALATGNTADAQQASLDMQGLQSDLQYNAQVKAIEDATTLKNAPLLKQIELIQKKQQDVGDAAAYAAEKFGDVSKKIDDEETAINKLIQAMANYRTAIDSHKDDLAKWKTSPEATTMLAAITEAAVAIKANLTPYPVDSKTGKPGVDAAAGLMGALETSLIKAGLIVNGDLYINNKKVGGTQVATSGAVADPSNLAGKRTGAGTKNSPYEYTNAAGAKITEKQFVSMPYDQPGSLSEFILPLSGMSNKEFTSFLQAQMLFLQKNNGKSSYTAGDLVFHHNGTVTKDREVIGKWFGQLAGGGEKVKSYEIGGKVTGPGTATSDSIPALLSNGEYVIKADSVKKYGADHFDAMNAGRFADGGPVGHRHGKSISEKQNGFQKYVSALTKSSDELPTWARDPLGVQAFLRNLAGQGRKGDNLSSVLMPLNFMGMGIPGKLGLLGRATAAATTGAKVAQAAAATGKAIKPIFSKVTPSLGAFGRAHLAGKLSEQAALHTAGELVDPVYANKVIMDQMQSGMMDAAASAGRRTPTNVGGRVEGLEGNFASDISAAILQKSDLGESLRKMWSAAFNEMLKSGNKSVDGMTLNEFFIKLQKSSPGVMTRYDDEPASLFVQEANAALMKSLGFKAEQPVSMYRSTAYTVGKKAPGYYSLSERFAREYGRQYTEAGGMYQFDPKTGGMYKADVKPSDFPSPIGMGGVMDEYATVLGEKATQGAVRVATDKLSGAWVRGFPLHEYFESVRVKNLSNSAAKLNPQLPQLLEKYPMLKIAHIQKILKEDKVADTGLLDFSRLETLWANRMNHGYINPETQYQELDQLIKLLEEMGEIIGQPIIARKFAEGGMVSKYNIPKFETGINNVPANMLAMLHKNEAVVPANMNPFNPNANNATMGGGVYNITNNINGYDGNLEQLSSMVTQKTITAIKTLDARTAKMTGPTMTVGIK